jgi:hypothetical protein
LENLSVVEIGLYTKALTLLVEEIVRVSKIGRKFSLVISVYRDLLKTEATIA